MVALSYPEPPLTGSGFTLRPFRAADFEAARSLERDHEAARWVPPLPAGDGPAVVAFYARCRLDGTLLHLVIADRDSDAYLGEAMVALAEQGVAEVGCCLLPAARGRGIAVEMLRLLTGWALESLGLGRVQVFVSLENAAALRLAERAGFRHEGVLRAYWEEGDRRLDVAVLSRLPHDRP